MSIYRKNDMPAIVEKFNWKPIKIMFTPFKKAAILIV